MPINQIYFSQHGLALDKSEDANRPLSADGVKQSQNVADQLKVANVPVSRIFHSGKLRAQQTAEIYSATLNTPTPTILSGMSPMDDCQVLLDNLTINHALYVGHLPHLDRTLSALLTGSETHQILQFQNSGVVCLTNNQDLFSIAWYLTPQIICSRN